MKMVNKHRGKLLPVEVERGIITWENREPTPDPEEALMEAIRGLKEQVDTLQKQQELMLEMLKTLKDKPEAEGSKASKKKQAKAKKE